MIEEAILPHRNCVAYGMYRAAVSCSCIVQPSNIIVHIGMDKVQVEADVACLMSMRCVTWLTQGLIKTALASRGPQETVSRSSKFRQNL